MRIYNFICLGTILSVHAATVSKTAATTPAVSVNHQKRGFFKELFCLRRCSKKQAGNRNIAYTPSKPQPKTQNCTSDFEAAFSEVKEEQVNSGSDVAYESMRDKLIMILSNLRVVEANFIELDFLEDFTPEDRVSHLRSSATAFIKCKDHFEAFEANDWEWFFEMAQAKNSVLRERHHRVFWCHFDSVKRSIMECSERYGIDVLDL